MLPFGVVSRLTMEARLCGTELPGDNIMRVRFPYCSKFIALSTVLALVGILMLAACGQFFPPADQITSLQISPLNPVIKPTATQQFTATATFGDNSSGDATNQVTWASSATNIATITQAGLVTAVALGTTTISASSGSVRASTGLTVSNQTVTTVAVTPSSVSLISGQTQQLTATATFSDNTTSNVTNSATWTSSDTTIATVTSTGFVTAVSTGTATVTATFGGKSGNSTITVQ